MVGKLKNIYHFFGALFAVVLFGYPARKLTVIGVTGTDGKTTTASIIYHILKKAGKKAALITTVDAYIGRKKVDTGLHVTTPNPCLLQKLINNANQVGCKFLVLEVTSHGLDQNRVLGSNITYAVVTNVTHEHLDYHKTFSNYLNTKAKIFKNAKVAFLNKSDTSYKKLIRRLRKRTTLISYDFNSYRGSIKRVVDKRFPEKYNQLNAAAAISVARQLGISKRDIIQAIKTFPGVPGRMEYVKNRRGINVIIDFAHTPNALENVLKTLREKYKKGRLIAVFGCAGERYKAKRSLMGEISARLADVSIFTAEDPRHEDVNEIINQMLKGARKEKKKSHFYQKISDRGEAIAYAVQKLAKRGDIVVVCGKGHEQSMAYGNKEYPWSDHDAINQALKGEIKRTKLVS